jgi:hypothetical protein
MSHSQFTSAQVLPGAQGLQPTIRALGPLTDVDAGKYIPPFVIHVMIIQSPDGDLRPEKARRAIGHTTATEVGGWDTTLQPVSVDTNFEAHRPARGIGVAVLARTEGFASEVLTWCDHLKALDGTSNETQSAA